MKMELSRRAYCTALAAGSLASLAGCASVRGEEHRRVGSVVKPAGGARAYVLPLDEGDSIILDYEPRGGEPSRMTVADESGAVVLDERLGSDEVVEFEVAEAGTYTVRIEWGTRAKIGLYTTAVGAITVLVVDDGRSWEIDV